MTSLLATPEQTRAKGEDPARTWQTTNLAELKSFSMYGPRFSSEDYSTEGCFVLRTTDINGSGKVDTSRAPRLKLSDADFKRYQLRRGDLLITRTGSLGTLAVFDDDVPAIAGAYLIQYRLNAPLITSRFVFYALKSPAGQRHLVGSGAGVGRPNLNAPTIEAFKFSLPRVDEQQRIVAEIEKQFTRLEAGVASLKRVQAAVKRYRASVLKAACEGRLVPTEAELARRESRSYETATTLLARIVQERRAASNGRGKAKVPIEPDLEHHQQIPEGWALASLDQLSRHITSGSRDWSQFYNRGTGTFILAQNVRPMRLDLCERQSVDAPVGDAETERTRVSREDLLVTIVGAKTGDVCRVPIDLQEHYVCQSVALLRPVDPAYAKFVELYLASPENGQTEWKRYVYGQGRPHLSFEQLRMTAVPLPPFAEQHRIIAEVERRLSVIHELQALVSANLQRSICLRQSILHRAFSGKSRL